MATNVLFIDDDKTVQQLAGAALSARGMVVLAAFSTKEADATLRTAKVDVIVLDILMDPEDGLSYCRRLREEGHRAPVILLSALADPPTVAAGIASGAAAYMIKPFDTEELYQRILEKVSPAASSPLGNAENQANG